MFPSLFQQIFQRFRGNFGSVRRGTRRRRAGGSGVFPPLEGLESRELLSATGFQGLDQGISGYDSTTGEWVTLRYDGESYVQEKSSDLNAVGRFTDPVSADFDGDGMDEIYLRDVATGNWWSINPAASANQLKYVAYWTVETEIKDILVGDVTGDGREEILAWTSKSQWIALSYNGSSFQTISIPSWESYLKWGNFVLADTNGNGIQEIIGRDTVTGSWRMTEKSGSGFSTQLLGSWTIGNTYQSPLVGDMNGDGRDEIISRDNRGSWWNLSFNGTGYQTQFMRGWDTDGGWREFVVTDLNGDGKDEVIGHQSATGKWWGLFQESTGFVSRQLGSSSTATTYEYLLAGDITGDGRSDVVSRDRLGNFWALTSNGSSSQVQLVKNWVNNVEWRDVMLLDYDGDGVQEIIGRNTGNGYWWGIDKVAGGYANRLLGQWGTTGDYLYVFAGNFRAGSGAGIVAWDSYGEWWFSGLNGSTVNTKLAFQEPPVRFTETYVGDVNGDGLQDIVGYDASRGNWWALIHDSTGTHNRYLGQWSKSVAWQNVTLGDFDGDGRTDIAGWDATSGNWWGIVSPNGAARGVKLTNWGPNSTYRNVMVLDINGDGRQEIVGRNQTGGWWGVMSDGTAFRSQYLKGWTESWNWENLTVVDLEGDGREEILGFSTLTSEWHEIFWTGTTYANRKVSSWTASETYSNLLVGDITGDGRTDIAAQNSRGGWWMLSFGGSSYGTKYLTGWNMTTPWKNFAIADLGGDGKSEIVAQDGSSGNWWGIFESGGKYDSRMLVNGTKDNRLTEGVQIADLNHDGADELVGYDTTSRKWWSISVAGSGAIGVQTLGSANLSRVTVGAIPGISDAALKQWLLKTLPNLSMNLLNDRLFAARQLMNWAANNADGAISSALQTMTSQTVNSLSRPSDMYKDFFLPNRGGVYCGGYSIFLNNILRLFGYDSFTLNFGDMRDDLTHVTVIVPVANGAGDWNYYMFDPTFNTVFQAPGTDRLLTVQEMFQKLQLGQSTQIYVRQDSLAQRDWLSLAPVSQSEYTVQSLPPNSSPGILVYSRPAYSINVWTNEIRNSLMKYGYSTGTTGYLQLLTKQIFTVGQSPNSAARERFIWWVKAYGIPV